GLYRGGKETESDRRHSEKPGGTGRHKGDAKYQKPVAWFRNKRTGRPISTQRFSGTGGGRHFPGMEGKRPPMPAAGGDGQRKDHGLYEADRKGTAGRTPGDRPDSGDR